MLDDACKFERYLDVVEDLLTEEMRRLRAFAELVSQNTLYRGKSLEYTPRIGAVRAPALVDKFIARCATEGYDIRASKSSYGRCVLRVHAVGRNERQRDQRDGRKDRAHEPHPGVQSPRGEAGRRAEVLEGPAASAELAEV